MDDIERILPNLPDVVTGRMNDQQVQNYYKTDESGKIFLDIYPSCSDTIFMLPFPFFCMGCCMSSTVHLTMDYQERSLSYSEASGHFYIFPCCRRECRYSFDDIQRVGYISTGVKVNKILMYKPVITLSDGRSVAFAPTGSESEIQLSVMAMHYYVYGRGNPNQKYKAPPYIHMRI